MMDRYVLRARLFPATLLLATALPAAAWGQAGSEADHRGPTRDALMATALRLSASDAATPEIMTRYRAYALEFEDHFLPPGSGSEEDFMDSVERRMATRFGDTSVYQWVQRGLVLYARFRAFTEVERRGFNMQVEVDDVADGKLGVRVNRALE